MWIDLSPGLFFGMYDRAVYVDVALPLSTHSSKLDRHRNGRSRLAEDGGS